MPELSAAEPPMSNGCPQVEALDRQTAAIQALTAKIGEVNERLAPAADAISDLGAAQKKLCAFLVRHRLKLSASIPVVAIMVEGASPNVARAIGELLKVWGVQ